MATVAMRAPVTPTRESEDTVEVPPAPMTRLGAPRANDGRITRSMVESRRARIEEQPVDKEKKSKISEQLSLILQIVRDLAEQQNIVVGRLEALERRQNTADTKSEAFAHASDARLEAFARSTNERLEALSKSLGQITANVATVASYADVVKSGLPAPATGTTSQGTPITQICSINPSSSASRQGTTSSPHVVIDFSTTGNSSIANEKPGTVRKRIDDALQSQEATKEIRCWGISRNPRDSHKFKVFFKDETAVQTIRRNDSWLTNLRGARLQAEQWYPIRVDSVYKGAILKDGQSTEVKEEAAQMVGEENGIRVHKLQWLSRPNADKIHGSMVLYLARREDAEKLLREVRVDIDGETAFARPYERRIGPVRCFKCHQFNHVVAKCPSPQSICSRCAEIGHTNRECTSNRVKCATCGGPHSTFDRGCRAYKLECEKVASHRI
ncbi:uncharacterized protein Z518_05560 [Rhinocladiella mackenziei CBS 650.93]|uniref:CCHC-type domain-containing protein n=1 Tax=Rhinocladiella mackenziei CBS 650.93 TaxID=1442369 RepID=A0A0D2J6L6_9EURO|nr:uncharacterized protein Z518_05560 [Rhinocladiella mackenziei CBS 650.93]KIX04690.1 hypothetical protein Z518_05560 [Rhinocladiella mackenziei CBS 650.93]